MSIAHRSVGRVTALIATVLGVALLTIGLAAPSHAASAYRFWGYFQQTDGKWEFSQKGADQTKPADGSVEGWRFALAGPTDTRTPRDTVTFDEVCNAPKAKKGTKQVAVVIDFGRKADTESGTPPKPVKACAETPKDATGAEVLAAAVGNEVRVENKLTCGILGWPAKGCGGEVKEIPAAAKAKDKPVDITRQLGTSTGGPAEQSTTKASEASSDPATKASGTEDDSDSGFLKIAGPFVLLMVAAGAAVLVVLRRRSTESA